MWSGHSCPLPLTLSPPQLEIPGTPPATLCHSDTRAKRTRRNLLFCCRSPRKLAPPRRCRPFSFAHIYQNVCYGRAGSKIVPVFDSCSAAFRYLAKFVPVNSKPTITCPGRPSPPSSSRQTLKPAARAAPAVTAPYLWSGNLSAIRAKSAPAAMKQEFSPFESKNAMEEGRVGCSLGCAHEAYLNTRTNTTSSEILRSSISGIQDACLGGAHESFQHIIHF
jgi:hypothetical protein